MSNPTPGSGSLKDTEQKRREVLKPILDNPFTKGLEWPVIDPKTGHTIVDYLTLLLSPYGRYIEMKKQSKDVPVPEVASKITVGFNSTMRKLEEQAAPNRAKVLKLKKRKRAKTDTPARDRYTKYVFVAKSDITTLLLTNPFPLLTFSASRSLQDRVKLVELPKGAMTKLLTALHTENVGILSLESGWKEGAPLFALIDKQVQDVDVPWLQGLFDDEFVLDHIYQKPAISFVKTSAPVGGKRKTQKQQKPQ